MAKREPAGDVDDEAALHSLCRFEDLSEETQEELASVVGDPDRIEAVAVSDILPSGRYGRNLIVLCEQELVVAVSGKLSRQFPLGDVAEVLSRDFVGNGVLEVHTKDGTRIELARYSRTISDAIQELSRKINRKLGLSDVQLVAQQEEIEKVSGPKESKPTYRCPNCSHPLAHQGDICPKCARDRAFVWRILRYLKPHWRLVAAGLGLSVIGTICSLGPGQLVRLLVDHAIMAEGVEFSEKFRRLLMIVGLFLGFISVRMVTQHLRIRAMGVLSTKIVRTLRMETYRALQRLSLTYYDKEHTGRIMSRVLSDTKTVQAFIVGSLQSALINILMIVGISVILFSSNAVLATVALGPIPVVILLGRIFSKKFKWIFRTVRRRYASLSAAVSEGISGVRVVKSFAQEDREYQTFASKNKEHYDATISAVNTRARFTPTVIFLMSLGTIVVWLVGGRQVLLGALTLGLLLQFITYMNQFYAPIQGLTQMTEVYQSSATSAERIFSIMNKPSDLADHDKSVELKNVRGRIELQRVSFAYEEGERILKDVDLVIESGQMIGVVGQTGAGKSTLVSLVCRFYDPSEGVILIDGVDLRDIKTQSLRNSIGMVLQDTFLFARTIKDNIAYGVPGVTGQEIIEAAKAANAHEFIMGLPDGYDNQVGERGVTLSGGEKQRISIARAVLKDPAILILDEATSAVDSATEASIQEAMDRLVQGRTTIAIAHRLSTLRNANNLIVIENGEIAEQGPHEALLAQGGIYANLCKVQASFAREMVGGDQLML